MACCGDHVFQLAGKEMKDFRWLLQQCKHEVRRECSGLPMPVRKTERVGLKDSLEVETRGLVNWRIEQRKRKAFRVAFLGAPFQSRREDFWSHWIQPLHFTMSMLRLLTVHWVVQVYQFSRAGIMRQCLFTVSCWHLEDKVTPGLYEVRKPFRCPGEGRSKRYHDWSQSSGTVFPRK